MKKTAKMLMSFFTVITIFLLVCSFTAAASGNPPQVKNLKAATVGTTTAKLTWNKISNVKYIIYTYNPSNKTYTKINTTSSNSYTVKSLKQDTTYRFCVQAYRNSKDKTYYGKKSEILKITTNVSAPAQVKNLKAIPSETSVKLSWSKVSSAKYAVYSYNSSTKKYTHLGNTSSTSCTIKNLKQGTTYSYAVRAFKQINGKDFYGKYSEVIKVTTKLPAALSNARKLYSDAIDVYMNWIYSCSYTSNKGFVKKELYGMICNFAPVNHPYVKTMSDLKKLLARHFDKSIYEKDLYLYTEISGRLYYYAEGGAADGITGVKYYTDSLKKISGTKYEYTLTPKYYSSNQKPSSFKFTLVKQNGNWLFTNKFYPCKGEIKTK